MKIGVSRDGMFFTADISEEAAKKFDIDMQDGGIVRSIIQTNFYLLIGVLMGGEALIGVYNQLIQEFSEEVLGHLEEERKVAQAKMN